MKRASVVAAVAVLLLTSACSSDKGGSESSSGGPGDDGANAAVCRVIELAKKNVLERRDLTFTDLVDDDRSNDANVYASALLLLAHKNEAGRLGPYEPVVTYLGDRNTAWTAEFKGQVVVPRRTHEVVESARRLDQDLAGGLCR